MDGETNSAAEVQGVNAPAVPSAPPKDEAKRLRAQKKQQVKRLLRKAESAESEEEVWNILGDLANKRGRPLPKALAEPDPEVKMAADVAPSNGWPTPEQTAAALPTTLALWEKVAVALHGTPFELSATEHRVPAPGPDGELSFRLVKVDNVVVLAEGTAPLAAHLGGKASALTPWTSAALCVAMVFGPPAISLGMGALKAWWMGREPEAAAEAKP